jgi:hypothetical protein
MLTYFQKVQCFPNFSLEEPPKHLVLYPKEGLRATMFTGGKTKRKLVTQGDCSSIANCCTKIPAILGIIGNFRGI